MAPTIPKKDRFTIDIITLSVFIPTMATATVIYDLPALNPDLFYAIRATVTDPMIFVVTSQGSTIIAHDTETDVLKREAKADHIFPYTSYFRKAKAQFDKPTDADVCTVFLKEKKIRRITIHRQTPIWFVERLRHNGIRVDIGETPLFPERLVKSAKELKLMQEAQNATFQAINHIETILRKSRIQGNTLRYQGKVLTSEWLAVEAKTFLIRKGYNNPYDLITSCGKDSTEPHNRGSGPIRPHQSIIVDIFPRHNDTLFFGDATRTFCKGKPSAELQRMYLAVKEAQEMAIRMVRPGVVGNTIHKAIHDFFAAVGFKTEIKKGRAVGFFHGTGHGLGLAIHEEPVRINWSPFVLKPGNVVTVEPGLYYPGLGAVRIEDVVVVTKTGCKVLGKYPKTLQV